MRQSSVIVCGFLALLGTASAGEDRKVVGVPPQGYQALEGVWVREDRRTANRVVLRFTWQDRSEATDDGPRVTKRPAIAVYYFRRGKMHRYIFGPVFLERSGKPLLRFDGRTLRYELKDNVLRFREEFLFDEEEEAGQPRIDFSGDWKKQKDESMLAEGKDEDY